MEQIKIACAKCREWIANVYEENLDLPITGSMFERRIGCESWEMPEPHATGMGLVCPHSITGDPGDLHLLTPHIPGKELEADELLIHGSNDTMKIEKKPEPEQELCPCGCEKEPIINHKSGNKYAHAGCHLRWLYKK
jgi:hypothetical protein